MRVNNLHEYFQLLTLTLLPMHSDLSTVSFLPEEPMRFTGGYARFEIQ